MDLPALDRERHLRGWSKQDLARQMGVQPSTLSEIYRTGDTSGVTFGKLAAALEAHAPLGAADRILAAPSLTIAEERSA